MPRHDFYIPRPPARTRAAAYCHRCARGFKTERGLEKHIADSRRHWECPKCGFDADGWDDLLAHCRATRCRSVCQGCDDGTGEHWRYKSSAFWQHVEDCNVCMKCELHFNTPKGLKQHNTQVHKESRTKAIALVDEGYGTQSSSSDISRRPDYKCLMCDRLFTTYSSMILHLESRRCSDVSCAYLDKQAAKCSRWSEFVHVDHREAMLRRDNLSSSLELYFCPCCEMPAAKLSGLFQHVESEVCGQMLDHGAAGKLKRHLARAMPTSK